MTIEDAIGSAMRRSVEPYGVTEAAWAALEHRLVRRHHRRRTARVLTAAAALVVSGAAFLSLTMVLGRSPQRVPSHVSQPVPILPIHVGTPETIPLHSQSVESVAATPEGIWVSTLSVDDVPIPLLIRLEPRTGEILERVETGTHIGGLVAGEGAVWGLGGESSDELVRIDPGTGTQEHLRSGVGGVIEVADGSVWVMERGPADGPYVLLRLDPDTGEVQATVPIPGPIWAAAADDRSVWLSPAHPHDGSLVRVDAATDRVGDEVPLPVTGTVGNVVTGEGRAWVSVFGRAGIWIVGIDGRTGEVEARDISTEFSASVIGVGHGRVWFLGERGSLDALKAATLGSDIDSDVEWDVWPTYASTHPSATLDPRTGDIWVGNYEGSVTRIRISERPG